MSDAEKKRTFTISEDNWVRVTTFSMKYNVDSREVVDESILVGIKRIAEQADDESNSNSPLDALSEKIAKVEKGIDKLLEKLEVARL